MYTPVLRDCHKINDIDYHDDEEDGEMAKILGGSNKEAANGEAENPETDNQEADNDGEGEDNREGEDIGEGGDNKTDDKFHDFRWK